MLEETILSFFTEATALAALAVVGIQQVLKLKVVPLDWANKYPVPVNIVLSVLAAFVVTWQSSVQPADWTGWVTLVALISVVAAITYNMTLRNWSELRSMEG